MYSKLNLSKFSLIGTSNNFRFSNILTQKFYSLSPSISKPKPIAQKRSNGTFHWRAFSSSMMSAMTGSMTSSGSFNCLIHCNKITRSMKLFFKSEISIEEQNELDRNKWIRNGLQWHEIFPYPVVPGLPKRTAIENGTEKTNQ